MAHRRGRQMAAVILGSVSAILGLSVSASANYPRAKIHNRTLYPATGSVHYKSATCSNDWFRVPPGRLQPDGSITPGFWQARKRGICLITRINVSLEGADRGVTAYTSSGTSYSNFIIQPTQTDFRVWSDHELARENAKSREGKSPGFHIENRTQWPISIGLEQVGCLYYGTIKPGEVFNRNTGAVWFTIRAHIQPDGREPRTDWDCIEPVWTIVEASLSAAIKAGAGAFDMSGASALAVVVADGTRGALVPLARFGLDKIDELLKGNGAGQWGGQYAGPEWPFRCDQKPTYVISGGWMLERTTEQFILGRGAELRLTKTNSCGNSMMSTASVSHPILLPPTRSQQP